MIRLYKCATPSAAMEQLREIADTNESNERETVVFCDDPLTLEAEQAICARLGGTFYVSVHTFAKYLARYGDESDILSTQGAAMLLRKIIENRKGDLKLFKNLSAVDAVDSVYETISRFYASGIKPDTLKEALEEKGGGKSSNGVLQKKLEDLFVIFSDYERELERKGKKDRAKRLGELPDLLRNGDLKDKDVVFFGYREFSKTGEEILRAAMESAREVCGIFCAGTEKFYSNAAYDTFQEIAEAVHGEKGIEYKPLCNGYPIRDEAERLKETIFNPKERCAAVKMNVHGMVSLYEASDSAEEIEYIATEIKRNLYEGKCARYKDIAVMIPDTEGAQREIKNTFSRYDIPCYIDVKHPILSHPLFAFVQNLVLCANYGPSFQYVDDIVSSVYFPEREEGDKLAFRNYMAKYGRYKGAVRKKIDEGLCSNLVGDGEKADDYAEAAKRVQAAFLRAVAFYENAAEANIGETVYEGTKALFESDEFAVYKRSDDIYSRYKDEYLEEAEFARRAPKAVMDVLKEAADLSDGLNCREYLKMIKSGANSMRLSLTPAKLDAVFVGDISRALCIDKRVVFAARMTDDVPSFSNDTKFISDRDIAKLSNDWGLDFGPKVEQDNLIKRETVALNACSFIDRLYLGYPVRIGKDEHDKSEILEYASAAFCDDGFPAGLDARKISDIKREDATYYCSELIPALMWAAKNKDRDEDCRGVMQVLEAKRGDDLERMKAAKLLAGEKTEYEVKEYGPKLYCLQGENCFSPTTLEGYFKCPYRNFIEKGLRASDSASDDTSYKDVGIFVHETLKDLSDEYLDKGGKSARYGLSDKGKFAERARTIAREKLSEPAYSSLRLTKKGAYDADRLCDEVKRVAAEIFEQLERSDFDICKAEVKCELRLDDTYSLRGKVDRVDVTSKSDADMIRVIDYKTGGKEAVCREYYHGTALQLPLYLLAESEETGAEPAGAFYLPAKVEYSSDGGKMILSGYADGTPDTMRALDMDYSSDEKRHIAAKCPKQKKDNGKKTKGRVEYTETETEEFQREDFRKYLEYGRLVSIGGIREMAEEGFIEPSPIGDACKYCGLRGCCGFDAGKDVGERSANAQITFDYVVSAVSDGTATDAAKNVKGE